MDAWPVWAIILGAVAITVIAYLLGSRGGRAILDRRALHQALQVKVRDVMTSPVVTIRGDATLDEAARTMLGRGIGSLPVVDAEGQIAGLITESDVTVVGAVRELSEHRASGGDVALETAYERLRARRVSEEMTQHVATINENQDVTEVARLMMDSGLRHVPVVRDGVPVGIVARHDLLRLFTPREPTESQHGTRRNGRNLSGMMLVICP
jgi:CBS domain-containing protein